MIPVRIGPVKTGNLEGKQDVRTEPDSTLPDTDTGARNAFEGSVKDIGVIVIIHNLFF